MSAKPVRDTEVKTTIEQLKINFTAQEKLDNAQKLARIAPDLQQLEDEKKSVMSQFKSRLESLQARQTELSTYVRDGWHYGPVECETTIDYARGAVTMVRKDTGEQIVERALTMEERQRGLL